MKLLLIFHTTSKLLVGFICILTIALSSSCSRLLFVPSYYKFFDPENNYKALDPSLESNPIDEFFFDSFDGTRLHGWKINRDESIDAKGKILLAHGNGENLTSHFISVYWLRDFGYDVYVFDYRGYGASDGSPSFPEAALDTRWAIQYVHAQDPELKLTVIGQSLGGSMVVLAMAEISLEGISSLILDSTFIDYPTVVANISSQNAFLSFMSPISQWLMPGESYSTEKILPNINLPILILHGKKDKQINFDNSKKILEVANPPKKLVLNDGGHIKSMSFRSTRTEVLEFIDKYNQ